MQWPIHVLYITYNDNVLFQIFDGNVDGDTLVTNTLATPVDALCLRITSVEYEWVSVLRFEVIGVPIITGMITSF